MSEGRPVLPRRAKEPADHNHNLRPQTIPTPRFAGLIADKEQRSRSKRVVLTKKRREKIAEFKRHFPEGIGTSGWIHNLVIFMDDPDVRYNRIQRWLKKHKWIRRNIEPVTTRHSNNNRSQSDEISMPLLLPQTALAATASLESNNRNLRPFRTSTPIQGQSTDNLPAAGDQQNRSSLLLSPDITANTADPLRNSAIPYNPNPNDTVPLRVEIIYENNEDQEQAPRNEVRERNEREQMGQQQQEPDQMGSRVRYNQTNYQRPQENQENQANQQIPEENLLFRPQPRPPSRCPCPQCRPAGANSYYSHVNSYYDANVFQRQYPILNPLYQYSYQNPSHAMADSSSNGLLNPNPNLFPTSSDSNHSNQIPSMNQPQPEQNNGHGTGRNSNQSQSSTSRGTTTSPVEGPVTHFTRSIKLFNIISRHFEKEVKTRAFLIPMGDMYTKLTRVYKNDIVPSHSKTFRAFTTRPKTERFEQAQEKFQAEEREREELDRIPDQYNQDGEPLPTTHHDEAEEESDSDINITQCSDL